MPFLVYSVILLIIQCIRLAYNRARAYFIFNPAIVTLIVTSLPYINDAHTLTASIALLILRYAALWFLLFSNSE